MGRPIRSFARIILAFAIAFVFTARMQAAAQHCARQANEAVAAMTATPKAEASACHSQAKADEKQPAKPTHHPLQDNCECVAFGKGVPAPLPALTSTAIAAFHWERPGAARVASLDLTPDGPPPKA